MKKLTRIELDKRLKQLEETYTKRRGNICIKVEIEFGVYGRDSLRIVDKEKKSIPFTLNPVQAKLDEIIRQLQEEGKPIRLIILKARQQGISTYVQMRMLHRSSTIPNYSGMVIAHTDKAVTEEIFPRTRYAYDHLPDSQKPPEKGNTKSGLTFDYPFNSSITARTAGGREVGRGGTKTDVHISELAFFEGNADEVMLGVMQSVPNEADTMVIIESTANGMNYFKEQWDKAVNKESDFTPIFFPWFDFPEYSMKIDSIEEEQQIIDSLTEYEQGLIIRFNVSLEQIKWRRWIVRNNCGGDEEKAKQEYPTTPEEAFLQSGRPFYNNAIIQKRINELEALYKINPFKRYDLIYNFDEDTGLITGNIRLIPNPAGAFKIYQKPRAGRHYSIGGDVSEGANDSSTLCVIDNTTAEQVMTWSGRVSQAEYGRIVTCIAGIYRVGTGRNKTVIESNIATHVLNYLQLMKVKQYTEERIDKVTKDKTLVMGYRTGSRAKRMAVLNYTVNMVNDNIHLIHDLELLYEMLYYIYSETSDRPDHQEGKHDDNIFAYGLSLVLHHSEQLCRIPLDEQGRPCEIVFGEGYTYKDIIRLVGDLEARKLVNEGKLKIAEVPSYYNEVQ